MPNHESTMTPSWHDDGHWSVPESAPDAGLQRFERILNFSEPANGNTSINDSERKPPKQLACTRCHAQKLRCVRKSDQTCDRCVAADVGCVARRVQRMGRPVDHHHDRTANSARSRHRLSRRGVNHTNGVLDTLGQVSMSDSGRGTTPWPLQPHSQSGSTPGSTSAGITAPSVSSSENETSMHMPMDSCPAQGANRGNFSSNSNMMTQLSPVSYVPSEMDLWSSWPSPSRLTSYADSLVAGLDGPNSLFPWFDELPATLFPATNELNASSDDTEMWPSLFESPLDDPVEQLSRFHLELYKCLTSVKVVEKLKKEKLQNMSKQVEEIDTSWLQQLFRTSERFIHALQGYVGNNFTTRVPTNTVTAKRKDEADVSSEVDTATGLMIVSCYMRLLQILEVVVFIIETYRDFDCPGNYVEVTFGTFVPKTDKALSARFLGQYVLHLLDGISEAVDRAIASRQPYARVIVDTRRVEEKLKERISTALQ